MTIAGTWPEQGLRVALELLAVEADAARYRGEVVTPVARHALELRVASAGGEASVDLGLAASRDPAVAPATLEPADVAFVRQLGKQLWRVATSPAESGGGSWPRRIQRWRGPK